MIARRTFIAGLGAAAAWPLAARGQQAKVPVIGYLSGLAETAANEYRVAAFTQGLAEQGYVTGRNVEIIYRWADTNYDSLPTLAAELARRPASVIVATSGSPVALAAKSATATIPIVFAIGGDPVGLGLVASLNRPGANVTGVSFLSGDLASKRLQLLHEIVPSASSVGFLVNSDAGPGYTDQTKQVEGAARRLGMRAIIASVRSANEVQSAFEMLVGQRVGAILVAGDPLFSVEGALLAVLAARHAMPASYGNREIVTAGGLMSYAPSFSNAWRLAGNYTGRILKGEKPADLPVQQSTKIEMVINLKTAKALGLTIPPTLLATADEVIE